jgi:hypothetical protein
LFLDPIKGWQFPALLDHDDPSLEHFDEYVLALGAGDFLLDIFTFYLIARFSSFSESGHKFVWDEVNPELYLAWSLRSSSTK